jgi:6-phosphogluconate dehydrogenase
MATLEFGVIGLGRMGGGLAEQALKKGMKVVGYDLSAPPKTLTDQGLVFVKDYHDFVKNLQSPRIIFIYIPGGKAVDQLADELAKVLQPGDIIVDGGNSYWGDSIRRHKKYLANGLHFVDLGTSGGVSGANQGACFMLGSEPEIAARIAPILTTLAVPNGFVHAGPPGAGHYVKLVHNGIEYGMLQAIGEGISLLENSALKLDIKNTLEVYRNGSVIRSWLIDLICAAYKKNGGMGNIDSYVDDTGEVNWLVSDAMHMEVPVPVIAQAVMQCIASRDEKKNAAKAVAMIRNAFGGHAFGHSKVSEAERYKGRVGDYFYLGEDPNQITHSKDD